MRKIMIGSGLAALVFASFAGTLPASAEFFGCNDGASSRTVSHRSYQRAPSHRGAAHYTHEFAAQSRPRSSHSRVTYYGSPRYGHERSRW